MTIMSRVSQVRLLVRLHPPSPRALSILRVPLRKSGYYIPPSQYDTPFPNRLKLGYVMSVYWETIPLFTVTAICLGFVFGAVVWECRNKVDVVFRTHSRKNISRTMDLMNPTNHKIITINQRYEPWPEMYNALNQLNDADESSQNAKAC